MGGWGPRNPFAERIERPVQNYGPPLMGFVEVDTWQLSGAKLDFSDGTQQKRKIWIRNSVTHILPSLKKRALVPW